MTEQTDLTKIYTIELSKYRENLDSLNAKRRELLALKRKEKTYSALLDAKKNVHQKQMFEQIEKEGKKTNESMRDVMLSESLSKDTEYKDTMVLFEENKGKQQDLELDIMQYDEETRYWRYVIATLNANKRGDL